MLPLTQRWLLYLSNPEGFSQPIPTSPLPEGKLESLFSSANGHGVLPALVANLMSAVSMHGAERISHGGKEEISLNLNRFQKRLQQMTAFSLLLRRQGEDVVNALTEQGLPAVILKGACFADRLYNPPSLRLFTDTDIMVAKEELGDVGKVMGKLGYRLLSGDMKYDGGYGQQAWFPVDRPGGSVEVHWNIVNSPVIQRKISISFQDLQLEKPSASNLPPCPSAASLLLIAATHAATSHSFDRLVLLYDIRQICLGRAGSLDETYLTEAARFTGAAACLWKALDLCGKLLKEDCCHELAARLKLEPSMPLRMLVTPSMVLRDETPFARLRRKAFRQMLKRS